MYDPKPKTESTLEYLGRKEYRYNCDKDWQLVNLSVRYMRSLSLLLKIWGKIIKLFQVKKLKKLKGWYINREKLSYTLYLLALLSIYYILCLFHLLLSKFLPNKERKKTITENSRENKSNIS